MFKIKILEGLIDSLEIQHGNISYQWSLDYEGIPFQCVDFHSYGHLIKDYNYSTQHNMIGNMTIWTCGRKNLN